MSIRSSRSSRCWNFADKKKITFGDLASETEELDLLTTALLFHDVGKGTPDEGHVQVSRRIAEQALRRCRHQTITPGMWWHF